MILRFINLIFLSIVLIVLIFPYQIPAREKIQLMPAHETLPDNGNLSEKDSIFDLNKREFKYPQEREAYELYLYSLSLRLIAIRNILKVSSVTRAIGSQLDIDAENLSKIPYNLKKNFSRERFPDLASLIDNAANQSFQLEKDRFREIIVRLASRALDLVDLTYQKYKLDITDRQKVEDDYKEKEDYIRTRELPGYNKKLASIEKEVVEKNFRWDDLSSDLFLYLPFYEDPWYKDLWNSVFSEIRPSFHFSHLLIATMFFESRPDKSWDKPEQFAKWLNSGIEDEDDFSRLADFYQDTADSRDTLSIQTENGTVPAPMSANVEEALKKAILKSIEMQNASLNFLAGSQYVCKERDAISCHANPQLKQTLLPEQTAFLSEMTGLKVQFANTYAPLNIISRDKGNILWHKLHGTYERQLKEKERNWIIHLRLLAFVVALVVPCGWVALAVLVGCETINILSAFDVAAQTRVESETLMSLYDAENSIDNLLDGSYSSLEDYKRFILRKDKYQTEAVSNLPWAPINIALYYFGARYLRHSYITAKEAILANPKSIKIYLKGAMFLALAYFMIKDSISLDGNDGIEIKIDDRTTQERLKNDPDFMDSVKKRRFEIYEFFISNVLNDRQKRYADRDIGFLDFICPDPEDPSSINIPIVVNDQGSTRLLRDDNGSLKFYINYETFTDDSTGSKALIFQMATVYYLHRTSDIILLKSLIDDADYHLLSRIFLPGSENDEKDISEDIEKYKLSLSEARKSELFIDAEKYASKIAGMNEGS